MSKRGEEREQICQSMTVHTILNSAESTSDDAINTKDDEERSITMLTLIMIVSILLAATALVFVVVIFNINHNALHKAQLELETLLENIETLENQLNNNISDVFSEQNEALCVLQEEIDEFWDTLPESFVYTELEDTYQNASMEITRLYEELIKREDFCSKLNETLNDQFSNATEAVKYMETLLEELSSKKSKLLEAKSTMCTIETEAECQIKTKREISTYYRRTCGTKDINNNSIRWIPVHNKGYHTMDIRCIYYSNYMNNSTILATAVLQKKFNNTTNQEEARCRCSVARPHHVSSSYRIIPSNLVSTCQLEVVRCMSSAHYSEF